MNYEVDYRIKFDKDTEFLFNGMDHCFKPDDEEGWEQIMRSRGNQIMSRCGSSNIIRNWI